MSKLDNFDGEGCGYSYQSGELCVFGELRFCNEILGWKGQGMFIGAFFNAE
jgi:hypothetical protein